MAKNADDLDGLVILRTTANEREAGVIRAALDEMGIESHQQAEGAMLGIWGASMDNMASILVRSSDLERAHEALENRRDESVDLDWDEVDVGEPVDQTADRIASASNDRQSAEVISLRPGFLGACGLLIVLTVVYILGVLFSAAVLFLLGVVFLWHCWRVRRKCVGS